MTATAQEAPPLFFERKFWPEMMERGFHVPAGIAADTNQRKTKERIIAQRMEADPTLDAWEVDESVPDELLPPTAKQAARDIAAMRTGPTFVYLAFHGIQSAQYLKVGISRHPEKRLYGMATGNPLPCLWAFVAEIGDNRKAYAVEQRILRHLAEHKQRGEWLEVGSTDQDGAEALARQLTQFVRDISPGSGDFAPLEYGDGR